jgi:hypothetical protein
LDGIQAWKKGLKEKELAMQEKNEEPGEADASAKQDSSEKGLDEIQIFKLLMKREEEKKRVDSNTSSPAADPASEAELAFHRTESQFICSFQVTLGLIRNRSAGSCQAWCPSPAQFTSPRKP